MIIEIQAVKYDKDNEIYEIYEISIEHLQQYIDDILKNAKGITDHEIVENVLKRHFIGELQASKELRKKGVKNDDIFIDCVRFQHTKKGLKIVIMYDMYYNDEFHKGTDEIIKIRATVNGRYIEL